MSFGISYADMWTFAVEKPQSSSSPAKLTPFKRFFFPLIPSGQHELLWIIMAMSCVIWLIRVTMSEYTADDTMTNFKRRRPTPMHLSVNLGSISPTRICSARRMSAQAESNNLFLHLESFTFQGEETKVSTAPRLGRVGFSIFQIRYGKYTTSLVIDCRY